MNVVMNDAGGYVEIQGTAEGHALQRTELDALLALAARGIEHLIAAQAEILSEVSAERRWVLATGNRGKLAELRSLLREMQGSTSSSFRKPSSASPRPLKRASTFVENALAKARHAARASGLPAIADDSGLIVDALGGEPGVRSARYAGEAADDRENVAKLLDALRSVPDGEQRLRSRHHAAVLLRDDHSGDVRHSSLRAGLQLFQESQECRRPAAGNHRMAARLPCSFPIYNERYVIERLVEAVAQFDYPRELLDIQVLDDSTDETQEVARDCVERYQALGLPISYIHRDNREGFKAGALQEGLKTATGEFVAIFDADFIPPADFLRRTVPYFADPQARHGADALELHQPQLFDAHRSGSDSARRPFRHRAFRALPQRPVFSISTARRASGGARRSKMPAAGSTTRSPKTPTFPIARNCAAGNFSICRKSSARPNCPWR